MTPPTVVVICVAGGFSQKDAKHLETAGSWVSIFATRTVVRNLNFLEMDKSLSSPLLGRASLSSTEGANVSPGEYVKRQKWATSPGENFEPSDLDKPAASCEAKKSVPFAQRIGFWGLLSEFLFYPREHLVIFIVMAAFCAGQQILVAATMAECMGGFYKSVGHERQFYFLFKPLANRVHAISCRGR
jgi:hypothetical protein